MTKTKTHSFKKNFFQDWIDAILWAFVVAMIIRNYTFQNFMIPSGSMESTLLVGDYLVANKMKYFFTEPKRGDIVTFRNPDDPLNPNDTIRPYRKRYVKLIAPVYWDKDKFFFTWYEKKNIVKRVVGMPGDKLEVINKKVFINDELYARGEEQYVDIKVYPREYPHYRCHWVYYDNAGDKISVTGSRDNIGPVIVPQNHYFVMGDNRDQSLDSRFWGFLPREDITGTPAVIFFSKVENGPVRLNRSFKVIK